MPGGRPDDVDAGQLGAVGRAFGRALDPVLLLRDAGMEPDPWQAVALRSRARRQIWLCSRQSGKSTTAAALALWTGLYQPKSLTVLASPTLDQSRETFIKVLRLYRTLDGMPDAAAQSVLRLELPNGSRVVSLPGSETSSRGYSADLLVVDEAGFCSDAFLAGLLPSTAARPGSRVILLSTPNQQTGMFYDIWHGADDDWERTKVTWRDSPRLTEEAVGLYRRTAGELKYRREFECEFLAPDSAAFDWALVERAMSHEVIPFDYLLRP